MSDAIVQTSAIAIDGDRIRTIYGIGIGRYPKPWAAEASGERSGGSCS